LAIEKLGDSAARSGVAILVAAGIVFEIIAAFCSSPQTAQINAKARAETLMKWVWIGGGASVLFVGIAAYYDKKYRKEYLIGGTLALLIMVFAYVHALQRGLESDKPGTEDVAPQQKQPVNFPMFSTG
jgi:hypothetical protein